MTTEEEYPVVEVSGYYVYNGRSYRWDGKSPTPAPLSVMTHSYPYTAQFGGYVEIKTPPVDREKLWMDWRIFQPGYTEWLAKRAFDQALNGYIK